MWVDICEKGNEKTSKIMPRVDIVPRKPIEYELRVIVWNCEGVPLTEDSILLGTRSSDIRFQGWLEGFPDKYKRTDVHYRYQIEHLCQFKVHIIILQPYHRKICLSHW